MASVRFVGSGDAFGSGGRLQTCILVEDGDWRCLLDCGTTSLSGLKAAQINHASIDLIIISHLHVDDSRHAVCVTSCRVSYLCHRVSRFEVTR